MIFASMLGKNRSRSFLALALMSHFYHVPEQNIGFYLLPLALGNFCGQLLLGTLFDTVGRRKMIGGTFAISGVLF
jgi:MFS family permease